MPQSYRSPKTYLGPSDIHGIGVFAKDRIELGEIVWIRTGHVVIGDEARKLDLRLGDFSLQIEDDFFLSPSNEDELKRTAIFFNHSCEPNVGIIGQVTFLAMRNIDQGEELAVDLATIEARPDFSINCNCHSKRCRGRITGNDWREPKIQLLYQGFFSTFIERQIKRHQKAHNNTDCQYVDRPLSGSLSGSQPFREQS